MAKGQEHIPEGLSLGQRQRLRVQCYWHEVQSKRWEDINELKRARSWSTLDVIFNSLDYQWLSKSMLQYTDVSLIFTGVLSKLYQCVKFVFFIHIFDVVC